MTLEALGYGCPLLLRYTAPQRSGRYWPRVLPGLATDTLGQPRQQATGW